MSFLNDIQAFSKNSLKKVATEIVTVDGRRIRQDPDGESQVVCEGLAGFVKDTKPDLQVGEVLPGLFIG